MTHIKNKLCAQYSVYVLVLTHFSSVPDARVAPQATSPVHGVSWSIYVHMTWETVWTMCSSPGNTWVIPSLEWELYWARGINTLRPRQNGRHYADDIFKWIFLNENVWFPTKRFVPKGLINNILALFQIMAWRRPGDKPLSQPMMVISSTHICVTRPQSVKVNGFGPTDRLWWAYCEHFGELGCVRMALCCIKFILNITSNLLSEAVFFGSCWLIASADIWPPYL